MGQSKAEINARFYANHSNEIRTREREKYRALSLEEKNARRRQIYAAQKARRDARKKAAADLLGSRCARCGYDRCLRALEFHHRDPSQKTGNLSVIIQGKNWDAIVEEVMKCLLLCANCHAEVEDGLVFV